MNAKRIFITGGASGLGKALALRYAREGWRVCIGDIHAGRGAETLTELKNMGIQAHFAACDVTQEADLEKAAAWLLQHWGGVDVVVNNAGVATGGDFARTPLTDWEWVLNINLLGVVRGCRVFTPILAKQGGGQLINIASAAGLVHMPFMSSYNTAKAAVVTLSETLSLELTEQNIAVSVVCPYFFRTNLTESLRATDTGTAAAAQHFIARSKIDAAWIAEKIFRGAARRQFMIIPNGEIKLYRWLKGVLPYPLYSRAVRAVWRFSAGSQAGKKA